MNKEWSELNKLMQLQIKKKDTFTLGIDTLLSLYGIFFELRILLRTLLLQKTSRYSFVLTIKNVSIHPLLQPEMN